MKAGTRLAGREFWRLGGLTPWELARRTWHQIGADLLIGRAAELAYFFLLSLFPLLLFLTTLLGYLARENMPFGRELFAFVSTVSPSGDVTSLLQDTLGEITESRSGGKLWLGIGIAVVAASQGVLAVGRTLNTAYGFEETRPWWRRHLGGIALIVAFTLLIVVALALVFFGEGIAAAAERAFAPGPILGRLWSVAQSGLLVLSAVLSFDLVYNFAPDVRAVYRVWITPGAVAGVGIWLAASHGFRAYVTNFPFYSVTYGSLGAVIVTLFWLYLTGMALLVGGELNSEIVKAARALRGKSEPREPARPQVTSRRRRPRAPSSG